MRKTVELDFEYMNYIPKAPKEPTDMYNQACSNDRATVSRWHDEWVGNCKANHAKYGPFKDHSIAELYGKAARQPVIVAGAGPSLKNNISDLKNKGDIPLISCLHNFHFMVDNEVNVDYYVSLDAGVVTIEEISEGGKHPHEYYIEQTKNKTLLAYIGSNPKLLASWKGKILFFACPIPDTTTLDAMLAVEEFNAWVSTGGNVLGACVYIAKAVMGCNPVVFVGADFCFSYTKQFHAWNSKYDGNVGVAMRGVDVWGNNVLTWSSYFNFKIFFDWMSEVVAGLYINCSEGGMLGAYPEGNISAIRQMKLSELIKMYSNYKELEDVFKSVDKRNFKALY